MTSPRILETLGKRPAERRVLSGSMWPTIREDERIRFSRASRSPRLGEIWVFRRSDVHVVHRVLWIRGEACLFKGDAMPWVDGWVKREQLFGPVDQLERGARWRPVNRRRDRALGFAVSIGLWPWTWTLSRIRPELAWLRAASR